MNADDMDPSLFTISICCIIAVAERAKLVGDVSRIESSMKDMEEEAGVAYVQTKEREAAVEANKGALETARAEVRERAMPSDRNARRRDASIG